jgi:tetratricopeptide (TPR) repeat protein
MIPLGPFVVDRLIGRGGMAEVWEGHHRDEGTRVAVKVLTGEGARDDLFLAAFRNEVRAAAGLSHPNIVRVWDHGRVDAGAELVSGGRMPFGSPWLVMELCEKGSLSAHCGELDWPGIRSVLLAILDALAHAHARGVVHRDLKPANVLATAASTWKLADFGLVHGLRQEERGDTDADFVGTPAYMAPEQVECRWRDYGPWTDLYALGCLGWALASGEPPFGSGRPLEELAVAQLEAPPPPLRPATRLPPAFEGWLLRLLEKEPARRFRRAADAAAALRKLDSWDEGSRPAEEVGTVAFRLSPGLDAFLGEEDGGTDGDGIAITLATGERAGELSTAGGPGGGAEFPPMPGDWRRDGESSGRPGVGGPGGSSGDGEPGGEPRLRDVGLGLFGLRSVPMVDRSAERDRLWQALREVHGSGRARALVLEGASGSGKSRLAEWLCERAHETGAAEVLRAVHSPAGGAGDGVAAMLGRHLRCHGLPRRDVELRVEQQVSRLIRVAGDAAATLLPDDLPALVELVHPASEAEQRGGDRVARFEGPAERHAVLRRFLARLAGERPVVAWLDDVQWSMDSVDFCARLLRAQSERPAPVLLLLTLQPEALPDRPREAAVLDELLRLPAVERLPVGPLLGDDRAALVRGLLGLDGELAARVEDRTAGNPLFAVQLLGDWVERGLLEPGPRGFRLRAGAEVSLPEDIRAVWDARVDRLLSALPAPATHALELAATLGPMVDGVEWAEACAAAGIEAAARAAAREAVLGSRLGVPPRDAGEGGGAAGFSFIHGMLRESLGERARLAGRSGDWHAAAARMLAGREGPELAERLARHLVAAGRGAEALAPMLRGIRERVRRGDLRHADLLFDERERVLESLAVAETDVAWVQGWTQRSALLRMTGDIDGAVEWGRWAVDVCRRESHDSELPRALLEYGNALAAKGELAAGREALEEAALRGRESRDRELLPAAHRHLSYLHLSGGELEAARTHARQAIYDHEALGDGLGVGHSYQMMSRVSVYLGELERARFELEECRLRFERAGARWGAATALNTMGEIARLRGDFGESEARYRESLALYDATGSGDAVYPRLNLALLLVERDRSAEAGPVVQRALAELEQQGRDAMEAAARVILLPCCARGGDWPGFDANLQRVEEVLAATGFVDPDIARMAVAGGDAAKEAGEEERAERAWEIGRRQKEALKGGQD